MRRDLRESSVCAFGRWITAFSWDSMYDAPTANDKFESFFAIIHEAVENMLPIGKVKFCSSDKPRVSSSMKSLVARRQHALSVHGKDSHTYRDLRNKVQWEAAKCKRRYFEHKVSSLKETRVSRWWKEIKALGACTARQSGGIN